MAARTKRRDHSAYHASRAQIEQAIPPARNAYAAAVRVLQRSATSGQVYHHIADHASAGRIADALDWSGYTEKLLAFTDHIATETVSAARAAFEQVVPVRKRETPQLPAGLTFDIRQHAAEAFAAQRAGERVTAITDSTRQAVNDLVQRALEEGWSPDRLAALIKNSVGLAPRYTQALATYENGLVNAPVERRLSAGVIEKQVGALRDKYLQLRADTISRSEVAAAQVAGRQDGWQGAVDAGAISADTQQEWLTGPDPCPECEDLEGDQCEIGGTFSDGSDGPPAHPNCTCAVALVAESL